jgi:ribonucleoside-diphosphate reductase alpha chain
MIRSDIEQLVVRKRDGRNIDFDRNRIELAMAAAFRAEMGLDRKQALDPAITDEIARVGEEVLKQVALTVTDPDGSVDVERIQDEVEQQLMRGGHYQIARRYIVYREDRARARALRGEEEQKKKLDINVNELDGSVRPFDAHYVKQRVYEACHELDDVEASERIDDVFSSLYDGITPKEIDRAMILAARSRIEREPAYDDVAVRLLLNVLYKEALGDVPERDDRDSVIRSGFIDFLKEGVEAELIDPRLLDYDIERLSAFIQPERDNTFSYLGLQTIYDRYLMHIDGRRISTPQYFWMRVAMGLSLNEDDREARAEEFYGMLSTFRFVSATPTLFNSGTRHPQLSSCYLSTVDDDLGHIFKVIGDNAALSKWAGGLGNDWTSIRATGAHIKGTNGSSQGVIPFLKIVNDTAVAVNQGGKRKGAVCSYLETWHLDVEDFLELRKNSGDERRRTHDMHTANWIPDLFMKRVQAGEEWTLFSPNEVPELHDLYGQAFEKRYVEYEKLAEEGQLRQFKKIDAKALWRKMLSMLFETGHPWITFKDPSNVRSPQDHIGVVHNSNLCTEILLNTSEKETAVCNLGSVNLKTHTTDAGLDQQMVAQTVKTALRMLDNVIDINFYPTKEAEQSNKRHRPVGLGIMGFQDAIYAQGISYASEEAVEFADSSMETISYHALLASSELAKERGSYPTYEGSKWDRGQLPIDTLDLLEKERGGDVEVDRTQRLDWDKVRAAIAEFGIRNSNVMAIAPTATISNISGTTQSIEPSYRNLFVKSNLSGDFTIVNEYLINDLKALNLWDDQMLDDLKYFDGSIQEIARVPDHIKQQYVTAFEIDPHWLIECASRRQKWIDMGQSLNLYLDRPLGKMLDGMYFLAWRKGLKTTYYLRSTAATQVEKSSVDLSKRAVQPRWMKSESASNRMQMDQVSGSEATATEGLTDPPPRPIPDRLQSSGPQACYLDDPDCEACQ